MDHPKKVLILYASAGHGHEKAAKAILEECGGSGSKIEAEAFDTLDIIPPFWGRLYKQVYYSQIKHAPWLWGFFYYSMDVPAVYWWIRWLRRIINSTAGKPLHRFISKENPLAIISTHFLSTEVASFLKGKGYIHSKLINVVTDYLPHHFWIAPEVDIYVVGLSETKTELVKRGVPENKIRVLGIPVEKKFLLPQSRQAVCAKLGLSKDLFTVLVTSGGAGIGELRKIADGILALKRDVQVLIVCGTNEWLFDNLKHRSLEEPHLKVFGFVSNMEELMEASDLVIGKAGGLTITESFVKAKPVILFRSVPGQEARNASCVRKYEAGVVTDSVAEVIGKVSEFLDFPERLKTMGENARKFAKPHATEEIVQLIENES